MKKHRNLLSYTKTVKKTVSFVCVLALLFTSFIQVYAVTPKDKIPPRVMYTVPVSAQKNVAVTSSVSIKFNEKFQKGANFSKITLHNKAKKNILINVSINAYVLTVKPATKLSYSTNYNLNVPAGAVKDMAGNALAKAVIINFSTPSKAIAPTPLPTKVPTTIPAATKLPEATKSPTATQLPTSAATKLPTATQSPTIKPAQTQTPTLAPILMTDIVKFNDNALEDLIRSKIGKPSGDVHGYEVESIDILDAKDKGIVDISALKYLIGLQQLDLRDNKITDITPLRGLTKLKYLYLRNNYITDISALSELANLEELYIGWNNITTDYSPITNVYENLKKKDFKLDESQKTVVEAQNIIDNIIKPGMSDFEKELAIHDYIVLNTAYDYDNFLANTVPEDSFEAYGVLIKHVAVCEGYTKAMQMLLTLANIKSEVVVGKVGIVDHSWNLVILDGKYYQIDVTWDDPAPDIAGFVSYNYFNVTDNEISGSHTWVEANYPKCTTSEYNYFSHEGLVANNFEKFKDIIRKGIQSGLKKVIVKAPNYDSGSYELDFIFDESLLSSDFHYSYDSDMKVMTISYS